jgi:hypothetical protein
MVSLLEELGCLVSPSDLDIPRPRLMVDNGDIVDLSLGRLRLLRGLHSITGTAFLVCHGVNESTKDDRLCCVKEEKRKGMLLSTFRAVHKPPWFW